MARHEQLVAEQWAELLKRPDMVGGNFYFHDNGECVGRIKDSKIEGPFVTFTFEWSARKTARGRWNLRSKLVVSKQMYRLSGYTPDANIIRSGNNRIETKGFTTVELAHVRPGRSSQQKQNDPQDQPLLL